MSEEERLKKQKELRRAWYEMRKRAEPPPTSTRPTCEAPLDLKTKRSNPNSKQSTSGNNCIEILDDKIIHNAAYVPPNVYIENNYYEPISPPENTNINCHETNNTTDPNTQATTAVQDLTEEPIEEYHVITHDQYIEYLTLKRRFENTQDETTEGTEDTIESGNNDAQEQDKIPSTREQRIQELIGMSDEYKNYILSLLNKGQQVNATVTANPNQENAHLGSEGINTTPANVPIGIQDDPLLNIRNEWQNQRTHNIVDVDATIYSKVPYVSQVPRRDYHQNEQEAVPTKINHRYTFIPSGPQQFVPHTYAQQQHIANTFAPSTLRYPGPTTQSDRQNLYPDSDEPNYCQQRWNNTIPPANKHQTFIPKAIPSGQTQAYPENEINPIITIPQRKPNPVVWRSQHSVEHNITRDRISYSDRIVLNNQQQIYPEPVERSAHYSAPTALNNNPPQRYEEPALPSDHQVYPEGVIANGQQKYYERVYRSSRQQRQYYEPNIPGQHQIHSNASQNFEQNLNLYRDQYIMQNHKQIYLKEIEKRSEEQRFHGVPSESPQRYHNPISTDEHPTHPTVMNSQPYRYPIPPAPYAQQHAYPEPTARCSKPNTQPKRQYQKRKETTQRQNTASLRSQRIRSSPVQPHSIPQVPPEMIRRMQPIATEMATSVQPTPEQMPEYYQQYYNQHHENPQVYRDQNYHNPYP